MSEYRQIPYGNKRVILVSDAGHVKYGDTGKDVPVFVTGKGYLRIVTRHGNRYISLAVHRLVAEMFIPKPESDEFLQVNHMDGDKTNNAATNLEWVTNQQNMTHARETGLFSNEKVVLAKNVETNLVTRYRSLSEAARHFLIPTGSLSKHLRSSSAGRIQCDGFVLKFDDGNAWPDLILSSRYSLRDTFLCDVVAKHTDGRVVLFVSLVQACIFLNLNRVAVNNHRTRFGWTRPYQGWTFLPLENNRV